MVGLADLRRDKTSFTELYSGESRSVNSGIAEDWKNYYHKKLKV
jgi:hypothetical protein